MTGEPVVVWPEHRDAVLMFAQVGTQWRVGGMGGATGLDYGVLFALMDRKRITGEAFDEMFDCIRTMESEALKTMREAK